MVRLSGKANRKRSLMAALTALCLAFLLAAPALAAPGKGCPGKAKDPKPVGSVGNRDFEGPEVFRYKAGYIYALNNLLGLGLDENGEYKTEAELNEDVNVNVYHDLNGTRLSEDFRVITKLAIKL